MLYNGTRFRYGTLLQIRTPLIAQNRIVVEHANILDTNMSCTKDYTTTNNWNNSCMYKYKYIQEGSYEQLFWLSGSNP